MLIVIRKKSIFLVITLLMLSMGFYYLGFTYSYLESANVSDYTILIDPGHGGEDGGAVGKAGTQEKDLNLQIALKLRDKLESEGIKTVMTRETDKSIHDLNEKNNKKRSDLNNRVKMTRGNENMILISIHMNSFGSGDQKGAQVFYSKNHPKSQIFAELIQEDFKGNVDKNNKRLAKQAENSIFLMKESKIPSCLIECGFVSNREEESLLKTNEYQEKIVNSVVISTKKFLAMQI